ncbi:MAG: hypothetical protein KAX49_03070 [Halanaerobiales bacterium]|nr:hypothetical protein [Halanaerobiales bacterium]
MKIDNKLDQLLKQATAILRKEVDKEIEYLFSPEVIKDWERNLIVRCKVSGNKENLSSIIIKKIKMIRHAAIQIGLAFISYLL